MSLLAAMALSGTAYADTLDCVFKKQSSNKYLPERVVFSVGQFDTHAKLHETVISGVETHKRTAKVERNGRNALSIAWPANEYVFTKNGRKTNRGNGYMTINMDTFDYSVFVDKRSMQAKVRFEDTRYLHLKFNTTGACKRVDSKEKGKNG
ncbi:hypothetical protein Q5Y75_05510 [Ruegeria sp. 2205SS24-7]|uniref:hypothetical protein n=1 Tax=Ruegeria discodermiae TaxID=3064389 RepID=UPI0027421988|nr:hypothetical protein [Ruegeria sp. 2205SS24-7]MDP5216667.1 hypothetical protein [Ruegeria sp. 2205SS24-7]